MSRVTWQKLMTKMPEGQGRRDERYTVLKGTHHKKGFAREGIWWDMTELPTLEGILSTRSRMRPTVTRGHST